MGEANASGYDVAQRQRTASHDAMSVLRDLVAWAEQMGGWEAPCWNRAELLLATAMLTEYWPDDADRQEVLVDLVEETVRNGVLPTLNHTKAEGAQTTLIVDAEQRIAEINNQGEPEQVRFLVDCLGIRELREELDRRALAHRSRP